MNHLKTLLCLTASIALVGCSATRYGRSTGQHIDDGATTRRVSSALGQDSIVEASKINVDTFRGNVHLTGFVDHPIQKERASQITRNVKGVQWFKNDIIVKEEMPAPQQMSASQSQFQSRQINEPSGASREQRQSSSSLESSSSGKSGWQKGSLHAYDPAAEVSARSGSSLNGTSSASASIASEPAGASNGLAQRINTQLHSDGSAAAQNVRVEASPDGKVTLRGMVTNDQEKRAIENRVKGIQGVTSVDNEIETRE